jgi:threonine/homoserine/homoserine lactone efflux protein
VDLAVIKFLHSLIIGILIAVPFGPIAIMCVKYSLKQGFIPGFMVGLGAGVGDLIYAALASSGLDFIIDSVEGSANIFKILGGFFLIGVSLKALHKDKEIQLELNSHGKLYDSNKYIFTVAFFTNIFNPITIIMFISLFSGADIVLENGLEYVLVPLGVFIGSVGWMIMIALFMHHIKHHINKKTAHYIIWYNLDMSWFIRSNQLTITVNFQSSLSLYTG